MAVYAGIFADLVVQKPSGQIVAAVEVRNLPEMSRDSAAMLHRNLLEHDLQPQAPYFLLVSQDLGYLWKEPEAHQLEAPPTLEFPMGEVMARYWPRADLQNRFRGAELRYLVLAWLEDLSRLKLQPASEPEQSLARVGFLEALRGATIIIEPNL